MFQFNNTTSSSEYLFMRHCIIKQKDQPTIFSCKLPAGPRVKVEGRSEMIQVKIFVPSRTDKSPVGFRFMVDLLLLIKLLGLGGADDTTEEEGGFDEAADVVVCFFTAVDPIGMSQPSY